MKKAYLAISYSNRKLFDNEVKNLVELFKKKNIELLVFVDKYNFKENEEKEMMKTAFLEIDKCDFMIAELTTKSIGVGIEIGYAYAKEKPIIYLRKKDSEYSTTASGCSTDIVIYKNEFDLMETMETFLNSELIDSN
ncbi:nucleoside 2-deoxyribosyltransferase [Yeosuana sp.]|uniref:nucleoside 2-deoxyribosyltransferase n=1 Tax=Yeosuana sp. TaxID=2529388 RepID=UPI004055300F|tara:strand:+ start:9794 stop:10204 length:411 start_codon:yes stop_codon:yes gene_type:complete